MADVSIRGTKIEEDEKDKKKKKKKKGTRNISDSISNIGKNLGF